MLITTNSYENYILVTEKIDSCENVRNIPPVDIIVDKEANLVKKNFISLQNILMLKYKHRSMIKSIKPNQK